MPVSKIGMSLDDIIAADKKRQAAPPPKKAATTKTTKTTKGAKGAKGLKDKENKRLSANAIAPKQQSPKQASKGKKGGATLNKALAPTKAAKGNGAVKQLSHATKKTAAASNKQPARVRKNSNSTSKGKAKATVQGNNTLSTTPQKTGGAGGAKRKREASGSRDVNMDGPAKTKKDNQANALPQAKKILKALEKKRAQSIRNVSKSTGTPARRVQTRTPQTKTATVGARKIIPKGGNGKQKQHASNVQGAKTTPTPVIKRRRRRRSSGGNQDVQMKPFTQEPKRTKRGGARNRRKST